MRVMSLVFSFMVTVSLLTAGVAYLAGEAGDQRIYVDARPDSTPISLAYRSYGYQADSLVESMPTPDRLDPSHQRYYSESEGWTYYTLP